MKVVMLMAAAMAAFTSVPAGQTLEYATPESQGVESAAIVRWLDACDREFGGSSAGAIHGFVIVRHGKIVAEGSFSPFNTLENTHALYSHSKSFTSTAIGFLVDDGKLDLDERVVALFPEEAPSAPSENLRQLRVRDLLTMNMGASFTDAERKDAAKSWVRNLLGNEFERPCGTIFKYDSGATYLLSAIVEKKSGMKLMDFLNGRLFSKLGIKRAWSTTSPEGIACGGWGMNMTTRELALFGQFYLQKGRWGGEQLLSEEWVTLATSRQTWSNGITVQAQTIGSGSDWQQGYGFQFWRCRPHGAYRADGANGQYTIVLPDQDAVVSIHAGLGNMQKEIDLVWNYLLPGMKPVPLVEDPAAKRALDQRLASLAIPPVKGVKAGAEKYVGFSYPFEANPRGYQGVRLDCENGVWLLKFNARAGEVTMPLGFGEWLRSEIRVDPEKDEGLAKIIGTHPVAASAAVEPNGELKVVVRLLDSPQRLEFIFSEKNGRPGVNGAVIGIGGSKFAGQAAP